MAKKHNFNLVKRSDVDLSHNIKSCEQSEYIAYHKTLELDGDLNLENFYGMGAEEASGLYVEGDLKVNGNIFGGTCVFLYVGGDLYVDSFWASVDEVVIYVAGNLYVNHFLVTNEDRYFKVAGEIHCGVRVHSPHIHYIEEQLKNTKITLTDLGIFEFWGGIFENDDTIEERFLETFKDVTQEEYEEQSEFQECPIIFIRKYWSFFKKIAMEQTVFPLDMIEDNIFDGKLTEKKVSEKTFNAVMKYYKNPEKPSEKECNNW